MFLVMVAGFWRRIPGRSKRMRHTVPTVGPHAGVHLRAEQYRSSWPLFERDCRARVENLVGWEHWLESKPRLREVDQCICARL